MSQESAIASSLTFELLRHVTRVANSDLAPDDTEALRRLFLDCFLVSLWGSTRPAAKELAQWSRRFAGTGTSWVLGSA